MKQPWRLESVEQPWGDYGDILAFGMTAHLERTPAGEIQLERTGPFVPPVFISGISDLLVRNSHRRFMEEAGLSGVAFRPVVPARIVELDWQAWDVDADEPDEYPESGEPADYILEREHDPDLAVGMGAIWEVVLQDWRDAPEADLVRGLPETRAIYVSDRAAAWFRQVAAPWIDVVRNPRHE